MPTAPYINDNPYRLLGIGSAVTQAELQQAADLADSSVKIGIPPSSGLMQVFGAEMLTVGLEKVRMLGEDPIERTIYRLFWPFDYQRLPNFKGTLADLLQSDSLEPAPSIGILQLRFVITWIKYLVQPSVQKVQEALDAFDNLCKEEAFYDYLVELLLKDGVEPDRAKSVGYQAPDLMLDRLLVVFRRQAVQWWESGEIAAVTDLVKMLPEAGFDDGIINKVLVDIVPCGEQEADRIRSIVQNFQGWNLTQQPPQPAEITKLHLLALALNGRVPAAQSWLKIVEERVRQVAVAMRDQARTLADQQNEHEVALNILAHIQLFPLPEDLVRAIQAAQADLQSRMEARHKEIWGGLTLIENGPSLSTLNGIGCLVYGRTPFAGDPDWYFTTYYFVVLFIPIFPIRRYLVADAPKGGWYFRASAPLSKFGRYHLITSLVVASLLLVYGIFAAQQPTTPGYSGSSSQYSNSSSYSGGSTYSDSSTDAVVSPEKQKLQAELAPLNTELYRLQQSIHHRRPLLESAAKKLKADGDKLDESDRSAVKAYNARVKAFQEGDKQLEADIKVYNKKADRANKLTERIQKLDK